MMLVVLALLLLEGGIFGGRRNSVIGKDARVLGMYM
jgi:hypothetical protein